MINSKSPFETKSTIHLIGTQWKKEPTDKQIICVVIYRRSYAQCSLLINRSERASDSERNKHQCEGRPFVINSDCLMSFLTGGNWGQIATLSPSDATRLNSANRPKIEYVLQNLIFGGRKRSVFKTTIINVPPCMWRATNPEAEKSASDLSGYWFI